ncbi:mitotic spindle checkpoint protein BUBR1 [Nymphaea colorata]|nr:mitotic spindle checkpoint protein BUBR1 [Nymphaea colorata]XP_049934146.1 mitotic spindle checkpoint protein BUBR1 [Nymphaea colorata]
MEEVDAEIAFLATEKPTGHEWELYKENVKPLKRGRNVHLLNEALKCNNHNASRKFLFEHRRKLIEAIDDYKGDDPLMPWLECIKWVQEYFPAGGKYSGLLVIYEQCVRTFWHQAQYKDDLRYVKVWLEYADNCSDAEVIYKFLDANEIGQTHSCYYISYALHMESKHKLKNADDIFNLGISRKAHPIEKLESGYRKFLSRSMRSCKSKEEESAQDPLPARVFGTVLAAGEVGRLAMQQQPDVSRKRAKLARASSNVPLSIYNDATSEGHSVQSSPNASQRVSSKIQGHVWRTLGTQVDRNKENTAVPVKWTSTKIPQKNTMRRRNTGPSPYLEVFVDDEFADADDRLRLPGTAEGSESERQSLLHTRHGIQNLKNETELLRENPLRHFPPCSLPR